jgi:Glucose-6-phosphate dehydrogenase, C-terminal domain
LYRIDHYLSKEMIRNVLAIRFANRIFSESWHSRAIESIEIISIERAGVEERLEYYDQTGIINDMVQSHLLQMLALVAMESPENIGTAYVLDLADSPPPCIDLALVRHLPLGNIEAVFFKTRKTIFTEFDPLFPWLSGEAAAWLTTFPLKFVDIDQPGIERNQPAHETHTHLLKKDILILEGQCTYCGNCCLHGSCIYLDWSAIGESRCSTYNQPCWKKLACGRYPENRHDIDLYACPSFGIELARKDGESVAV